MDWYAVHTHAGRETVAEASLRRIGVETLSPRVRRRKVARRRGQTDTEALFPGYLFARFNFGAHYRIVRYTRGVREVVAFGGIPARLDEATIESIKARLDVGWVTPRRPPLTPGQTVRLREGPLAGIEAVFERELSSRQRVVLLLRVLSYQARLVVAPQDITEP